MTYTKTNWVNDTTALNATNLNHIETGIDEATDTAETAAADLATHAADTTSIHGITNTALLLTEATAPGHEYDYVERTTNLSVAATTAATADTFISGNAVAYDGSTRIIVVVFVAACDARQSVLVSLWDGVTDLGSICGFASNNTTNMGGHLYGARVLTPSAASHTYTIKAWRGATSATLYAASGGVAGEYLPAFMRITKA